MATSHLAENAALQLYQVGSNDSGEAVYFIGQQDGEGRTLDCSGGAVYEVAFAADALPPIDEGGFWSLTMYGPDNLLVANPIDRYSTRATRPGFEPRPDGSVVVTLAHELPAGVPEAAWLPAPDGPFRLGLRLYYPRQPIIDGTWQPPAPTRVG